MDSLLFYPFAGLAILGALGVVTFRRPTRALLSLILTMFSLAVLFLLLEAYFVAMVHLVVYAGAVLVLFLFVIMLLGIGAREPKIGTLFSAGGGPASGGKKAYLWVSLFVPLAFLGFLLYLAAGLNGRPLDPAEGSPAAFGRLVFTRYLLPFELVSFLLLIGVFAAVALASPQSDKGTD